MQAISLTLKKGSRLWLRQLLFVLLIVLLFALFFLGFDLHYKVSLIYAIGANPSLENNGEIRLFPVDGLPLAQAGLQDGDLLVSVNGLKISSTDLSNLRNLILNQDNTIIVEVLSKDGTIRTFQIPLREPIPALFSLSAITIARLRSLYDILLTLGFSIPALIIFWRKSGDRLGIFVSITLLLVGFRYTETILFAPNLVGSILAFLIYTLARILLLNFLFIFPSGTHVASWTKPFVYFGAIWAVVSLFFPAFYGLLGQILEIAILTAGLWSQIYRYQHVSSVQEKQQTKWIVFGIVVAFAVNYLFLLIGLTPIVRESEVALLRYQLISQPLIVLSLLTLPLAVCVSIFRYRLYEIDIIINRALVYGSLTAILSGLSVALVGFLQRLTLALSGEKTEAATVITTLVVASAITPLKSHVQAIVDARFKEAPDPGKALNAFIQQVRHRLFAVHLEQITRRLLEESVLAFNASGGAVYLDGESPTIATRAWDGREQLKIPIVGAGNISGALALGPRKNGADYTAHDWQLLQQAINEIAIAIEQDQDVQDHQEKK